MPNKAIPFVSPYLRRPTRSLVEYLQERLAAGQSISGFEPYLAKATGGILVPLGEGMRGGGGTQPQSSRRKPAKRQAGRSG